MNVVSLHSFSHSFIVGVPTYRISQMVKNGGNVLDAYGLVNVVSPCGLPLRGVVGISPDPMMFVALNCQNIEASKTFYNQLGFVEQVSSQVSKVGMSFIYSCLIQVFFSYFQGLLILSTKQRSWSV